jgi:hypothetical protein
MECGRVAGVAAGVSMEVRILPVRTFLLLPQRAGEPAGCPRPDDRVTPLLHDARIITRDGPLSARSRRGVHQPGGDPVAASSRVLRGSDLPAAVEW